MKTEKVYSPISDASIKSNIANSPIWKNCYHEDDLKPKSVDMICYHIKFDGLKPVQVTNIEGLIT